MRLLIALLLASAAHAQDGPSFFSERTTVWLDRTQVVPLELSAPREEDTTFAATSSDPTVVFIEREPVVLAGETLGWMRVRGLRPGEARLSIEGAALDVRVRTVLEEARIHRRRVVLTGPASGACVWGTFEVGVDVWPGALDDVDLARDLRLLLPDGSVLEPRTDLPANLGFALRATFTVDASKLAPGSAELVAVLKGTIDSDPVRVTVVRVEPSAILGGECEASIDTPRPEGDRGGIPRVGSSPRASGGRFVSNAAADPAWLVNAAIPEAGLYQLAIVARGDFGGGAFPSVGLYVDGSDGALTTARLVRADWHRLPLGFPVRLEAGGHLLSVRFLNDFSIQNTCDRNLALDRFELVRVDGLNQEGDAPGAMMSMASMSMTGGGAGGELSVAFDRAYHGLPVSGRLNLLGNCRWSGGPEGVAPLVELLVNGEVRSAQHAAEPLFGLDRAHLSPGPNRLQLRASLPGGRASSTTEQVLVVPGDPGLRAPRTLHRFSVFDPRWNGTLDGGLTDRDQQSGHLVAAFGDGAAHLELPDGLEGEFDLLVEAQGPAWPAQVRLAARVVVGNERVHVGEARFHGYWNYREVGRVTLGYGSKTLVLERSEKGTDVQLRMRAVLLRENHGEEDREAPRAELAYPPDGHTAYGVDAVVVRAWDDDRLQAADVVLDGQPRFTYGVVPSGAGHVVLPLLLRDVAPGKHTLAVRVMDLAGNVGESETIEFTAASEAALEPGAYARAIRLLNRFAYGPDPEELAALLLKGERGWLEDRLGPADPGSNAALELAATYMEGSRYHATRGALKHVLRTGNPVRARFVNFVENHFSTWIGKAQPAAEWFEHVAFQKLGPAPFAELLWASATSPGMLTYLDQATSYAGQLNENYAREIMELHTLGVNGGYTQSDVRTLAELLAGMTLSREAQASGMGPYLAAQFRFAPDLGDGGARTVLGMRFDDVSRADRFDRTRLAFELLVAHPSTARFIASKVAEHYAAAPAPEGLVDDLAAVFSESGGDFRELLLALAEHPAFWDEDAPPRVTTPFDYAVRLARTCGQADIDWAIGSYLERSGMGVFDRATPDGYPEDDQAWVGTNAMMQRWSLVQEIGWVVRNLVPQPLRAAPGGDVAAWRQRVIDVAAVRLTGWTLGEESNVAALEFMRTVEAKPWERADLAASLVARLPEASLK